MYSPWPLLVTLCLLFSLPSGLVLLKSNTLKSPEPVYDADQAPPPCTYNAMQATITRYLAADLTELRSRTGNGRIATQRDYISCLATLVNSSLPPAQEKDVKVWDHYYHGVLGRMQAEQLMEGDRASVANARTLLSEAMNHLNSANAELSDQPYVINERGIVHELQGEYNEAQREFRNASRIESGWALPYSNLANVLLKNESGADTTAARQNYETALQKSQNLAVAHLGLGNLTEDNDLSGALTHWEEAYTLLPGASQTRYGYARGLIKKDSAVATGLDLYRSITADSSGLGKGKAFYGLGYYHDTIQDYNSAISNYEQAGKYVGDSLIAIRSSGRLGLAYKKDKKEAQGRSYFIKKLDPKNPNPGAYAAYILLQGNGWIGKLNQIKLDNGRKGPKSYAAIQDISGTL